jgi:hypothetical protein
MRSFLSHEYLLDGHLYLLSVYRVGNIRDGQDQSRDMAGAQLGTDLGPALREIDKIENLCCI